MRNISCFQPQKGWRILLHVRYMLATYGKKRIPPQGVSGHKKGRFSEEKRPETAKNV